MQSGYARLGYCSTATGITHPGLSNAACATTPAVTDITNTSSVVAVVYSVGKNFASSGAAGTDEQANWTPDTSDTTKLTTTTRDPTRGLDHTTTRRYSGTIDY